MLNSITKFLERHKRLVFLASFCLLALFLLLITPFLLFGDVLAIIFQPAPLFPPKREARKALILVVEDNGLIGNDKLAQDWYKNNKDMADTIFTLAMRKPWGYFAKDKTLGEITDNEGEDFILNSLSYEALKYEKIVPLKDSASSFSNFKQQVIELSAQGYTVDVVLSLHGNSRQVCFYKECVYDYQIADAFPAKNAKLGFVYSTTCNGSGIMNSWIKAGAKVANGSSDLNSVVIVAPSRFLKLITEGKTYQEAVTEAYNYELGVYNRLSFIPAAKNYLGTVDPEASKMLFAGDPSYKCF